MGFYERMLLMVFKKKDQLPYLFDYLLCKIAPENKFLVLLAVCSVERYSLNLIQFPTLNSKHFCKATANSLPKRRTRYLQ